MDNNYYNKFLLKFKFLWNPCDTLFYKRLSKHLKKQTTNEIYSFIHELCNDNSTENSIEFLKRMILLWLLTVIEHTDNIEREYYDAMIEEYNREMEREIEEEMQQRQLEEAEAHGDTEIQEGIYSYHDEYEEHKRNKIKREKKFRNITGYQDYNEEEEELTIQQYCTWKGREEEDQIVYDFDFSFEGENAIIERMQIDEWEREIMSDKKRKFKESETNNNNCIIL